MAKDYYKILGITEEEKKLKGDDFKKVLKSKYKKLCKEWHPDLEKDESKKKEKEEKFKEIAEANAVLSDEKKREEYDNPISGGANFHFDGMGMDDIFSMFGDMFGGASFRTSSTRRGQLKGENKKIRVTVTLEDLFNGLEKEIKFSRKGKCTHCDGSGCGEGGEKLETCKHCGGSGFTTVNSMFGAVQTRCPHCGGRGRVNTNKCHHCGGSGQVDETIPYTLRIPKGLEGGSILTVQGQGHYPLHGKGERGDLEIQIVRVPHERFERDGNDLYVKIDVPVVTAILGGNIDVETIDGKQLTTKIPQGIEEGTKIRFSGKGMPIYGNEKIRGNMIGIIHISMPKKLTNDEVSLLNQLKDKPNFSK